RLKTQPVPLHEPRLAMEDFRDAARDVAEERSGNARSIGAQRPGEFAIAWRESREIVSPDVVSLVRNFRRNGLPIVHLYQSDRNLLAIGLNNHGMPGIYFTRHVAE
ncbi:MAG TPA: hypothetical protein VGN77_06655, partial [Steroidobacteraceae bacterium]|nr:hypothetical protein [Steroidobacteraceae bacterium]